MQGDSQPILADELEALFGPFGPSLVLPCALAVSGGSDSVSLMVLFAEWLRQTGAAPEAYTVLTVDHHLRPESGAEAAAVAQRAIALGFRHAVLAWEGQKPTTGVQAAARAARYRLMRAYMAAHAMPALVTAHTLDDQAETLLMRLARGSGLDGLAAMAPRGVLPSDGPDSAAGDGPLILRPLLAVAKARLRATLEARGIPWAEDPSNEMAAFERSRLRAGRGQLDGLGLTSDMLALSARRLRRARAALDAIATSLCAAPGDLVRTDPVGVLAVDCRRLSDAPKEIALRIIGRCIQAAGGSGEPVPLASLEVIVEAVHGRPGHAAGTWTLARARISAAADAIQFEREPGRLPLPRMAVQAGTRAVWDGRFAITVADGLGPSIEVQALGAAGVRELRRLGRIVRGGSPQQLVPSFWQEGHLLAVPALGFWASEELEPRLAARFLGLRYNSPLPDSDLSGDFPGV